MYFAGDTVELRYLMRSRQPVSIALCDLLSTCLMSQCSVPSPTRFHAPTPTSTMTYTHTPSMGEMLRFFQSRGGGAGADADYDLVSVYTHTYIWI